MATSTTNANNNAFDTYYQEFAGLLKQLESTKSTSGSESTSSLHKQCTDLISLMALEARTTDYDPDVKFERLERVKIYKFQLASIQMEHDKDFLMGSCAATMLQLEKERQQVRTILENNIGRAAQQHELLDRARQSVQETEEVAMELQTELQRNRETIESAHGHVNEISSMAERAGKLVKTLSKPWWMPRR